MSLVGIYLLPPSGSPNVHGVIDRVAAYANQSIGIEINMLHATGGSIVVTIADSTVSNNGGSGIFVGNGLATLKVSIDNVTISGNGNEHHGRHPRQRAAGPVRDHWQWHRRKQHHVAEHVLHLSKQPDRFERHRHQRHGAEYDKGVAVSERGKAIIALDHGSDAGLN